MSRLTFQEKMLWLQLVGILVTGGYYAVYLAHSGPGHHYFHAFVLVLLLILGCARMIALRRSSVLQDERDRTIAAIGSRWSNVILWTGLVLILIFYWDHGVMRSANYIIGILFHLLLLAGIARIVRELVAYRMAA